MDLIRMLLGVFQTEEVTKGHNELKQNQTGCCFYTSRYFATTTCKHLFLQKKFHSLQVPDER